MILEKEIRSKIQQDYLFISGKIKINSTYFIEKIEESIKTSGMEFTTNVKGFMTPWDYFVGDDKFLEVLLPIMDKLDEYGLLKFEIKEAWGLKEGFGQFTMIHNHLPCYLSGVLYLNDHNQKLEFTDINTFITPEEGRFVVFSSFLNHKAKRNTVEKPKYAIAFNCHNMDLV
jgi:hypothetical protein